MNSTEKEISYQITNTYSTLNTLTEKTKNIWLVCHGMGYLSRYFLKYFNELNIEENYLIAPQASSKYYAPPSYRYVGSSWLTKENTTKEIDNVIRNFDAVFENEKLPPDRNLIVLGYSQGVSVAMRYVAKRKLQCSQLVLMSGGIPKELVAKDFDYLKGKTKVTLIYGTKDEFMDDERKAYEAHRALDLFDNDVNIIPFEGNHMVNVELINRLV